MTIIFWPFVALFNLLMRIITLNFWGRKSRKMEKQRKQRLDVALARDYEILLTFVKYNPDKNVSKRDEIQNLVGHFLIEEKTAKVLLKRLRAGETVLIPRPHLTGVRCHSVFERLYNLHGFLKDPDIFKHKVVMGMNAKKPKFPKDVLNGLANCYDADVTRLVWGMTGEATCAPKEYSPDYYWEYIYQVYGPVEVLAAFEEHLENVHESWETIDTCSYPQMIVRGDNAGSFGGRDGALNTFKKALETFPKRKSLRAFSRNNGAILAG